MKPTKCSAFLMFPGTASVHRDMRHQNMWDAIDSKGWLHVWVIPLAWPTPPTFVFQLHPKWRHKLPPHVQVPVDPMYTIGPWIIGVGSTWISMQGCQLKVVGSRNTLTVVMNIATYFDDTHPTFPYLLGNVCIPKRDPVTGLSISSTESVYFALFFSWKCFTTLEKARKGREWNKVTEMWHECDTN